MKFRQIKVETSCLLDPARQKLVQDFLSQFDSHIRCETVDQRTLNLFVNRLDFQKFKASADHLTGGFIGGQDAAVIHDLVSAVDSVKSYGLKAGKRIYVGYNSERKVKNRRAKSAARTKDRSASGDKKGSELPPEYQNKIICGDSLTVLKRLPDNCIDLMLTSPPYNFGLAYQKSDDTDAWETYFKQLFDVLEETHRVLKHGGRLVINVQPLFSDYVPTHHIVSRKLLDVGMLWKGEILWEKNNYNCKYTAWGSWKSPSSPYLKYTWEFLEVFCKGSLRHSGHKNKIDITKDEFKKWVYAKWSISPERKMEEYGHPAMFPEALAERVIKLFSYQDDVVLDVFNGAGTTTMAAKKLNRRYLGIDISERYCRTAEKRMEDAVK